MANFESYRENEVFILGCGVECEIQSLMGIHQKWITNQNEKKRLKGFIKLMVDCIIRVGNDTNVSEAKVERMLNADRKQILVRLRQLSTDNEPNFVFDYEFPAKTGQKMKERYDITFDENDFPLIPFIWVRDQMVRDYKEKHEIKGELEPDHMVEAMKDDIPLMYETYDEMLEAHSAQEYNLPKSGVTVFWTLSDGKSENDFGQRLKSSQDISSHTELQMRYPKYIDDVDKQAGTKQQLPLDRLVLLDIEGFRKNMKAVEGEMDTLVAIQYKDTNNHAQINLITVTAFFFPSLAI